MKKRNFQMIETNGVRLNTVVEGKGPLVILLHGFPQTWYLWRHQIDPLVEAGFQVAVPDQRGFGDSDCPPAISDYNMRELTADVAGIAQALGHETFYVIGHDWGCVIAWNTALMYPDKCKGVMGMELPYWRTRPVFLDPPGLDDRFWYIRYFQEPGVAEAEFAERPLEEVLLSIFYTHSGDAPEHTFIKQLEHPRSSRFLDFCVTPKQLPAWLTPEDMAYYVAAFRKSGFRGGVNYYRNVPVNNDLTPELESRRFTQPAAFIAGSRDDTLLYDATWREWFPQAFDDLRFIELVEGSGHWTPMEKPDATTALMLRFLRGL